MKKKKKSRKPKPSSSNPINGSDSSTFHVSIATTAVAQICHSAGFKSTQTTALQTLTNITVKYLTSLATSAATSASSSGRTESNVYDVIRGLEEVHGGVGFKGCSGFGSLGESEMVKGLVRFVDWGREVPFAKAKALSKVASSSRRDVETATPLKGGEKRGFSGVNEGKSEGEVLPRGSYRGEKVAVNEGKSEGEVLPRGSYCGEKEGVNEGKRVGEDVPRGKKEIVKSLCKFERLNSKKSYCGEKGAVNEGKSEGEYVPRGKQIVKSVCENERLNSKKSYRGEKVAVNEGKSVGEKKVPRGKQIVITGVNEGEKQRKVPRGKRSLTSLYGECNGNEGEKGKKVPRGVLRNGTCHVPKWLPDFPDRDEKQVFTAEVNEGKNSVSEKEKVNYYHKEVSELPEVRKKVKFELRGKTKTKKVKDVIKVKLGGVDLRSGVCKGGKRILFEIYENVVKSGMVKKKSAKGG